MFCLLFGLLSPSATIWAGTERAPCSSTIRTSEAYIICEFDLKQYEVKAFWKGDDGQPYGSLSALSRSLKARGTPAVMSINAGMFDENNAPIGLYIEKGRELVKANVASATGNFYLKPNGIFYVRRTTAGILETSRYLKKKPAAQYATQSGPMLVINGKLHPKFAERGTSRKIRNGVGIRNEHTVVFVMSTKRVAFAEFARFFRDELKCDNALYLDGEVSAIYVPGAFRKRAIISRLGPMLAVFRRGGTE